MPLSRNQVNNFADDIIAILYHQLPTPQGKASINSKHGHLLYIMKRNMCLSLQKEPIFFFAACFMDAFPNCNMSRRLQTASAEADDHPANDDFDLIISAIRSRAMEKLKRKPSSLSSTDNFSWVYSTKTGELYITQKADDDEREEYLSVGSCFSSHCSSSANAATNMDVFLSVKTSLSRCSSLDGFDFNFNDFEKRQSIFRQLCHCQDWPFGLCRQAVLLPPLPKSPSDSWTWRKAIVTKSKSLPFRAHTK